MNASSLSQRYLKSNDKKKKKKINLSLMMIALRKIHASLSLRCLRMIAFHTKNTALLLDQSSRSTNLAQKKKVDR